MTSATEEKAKVLPFRVNSFKIPVAEFEEIVRHIEFASFIINQDMPLDWEDRDMACRRLCDALCALRDIRRNVESDRI